MPTIAPEKVLGTEVPVPASAGLRFANLLVDYAVQFGIAFVIAYGVVEVWGEAGYYWLMSIPDIVFGLGIAVTYYLVLEWAFGRTIGKLLTGTRAVTATGERLGFGKALGRTLCRFIPFEAFSFLGMQARGWHDSIPNTYVVKCR